MHRVLLAAFKQETATFNPVLSRYGDFHICRGEHIVRDLAGTRTEIGGALSVFAAGGLEVLPAYAAWAVSGGPVARADLERLIGEFLQEAEARADVDGALIVFHGAMAGEDEDDPEGRVLEGVRRFLGAKPVVCSLDLHAVLKERLLALADALVPFHTYPHTDQYETGERAARLLVRLLSGGVSPTTARIPMPMLVRGDELLTATGLFGRAIEACRRIEAEEGGLAAGVLIGNPFTDVPALRSNVVVTTDNDPRGALLRAERIARFMWQQRQRLVAPLTSLEEAVDIARRSRGLTVFSDAADATSSGAPGDSNAVLAALLDHAYPGRALLTLVDAPAVEKAFALGVGARHTFSLGGTLDPARHRPLQVEAYVKALADGEFAYEDGTPARAGRSAVLVCGSISLLLTSRPVSVMGRRLFCCHGLDPEDFDLVSLKSPNGFRTHYQAIAARIIPVDAPGATSANLRSLPYSRCPRPIFPLDADVDPPFSADGESL